MKSMLLNQEDENNDIAFSDDTVQQGFQYGQKAELTHDQLILLAMKRCMEEGAKEMHSGTVKEVRGNNGQVKEVYVDDQRQTYIQSVQALYDILLPRFNDDMWEADKKFNDDLTNLKKSIMDKIKSYIDYISTEEKQGKTFPDNLKVSLHSQIATESIDPDSYLGKLYSDAVLKLYRTLYQSLVLCYSAKGFGARKVIR